MKLQYWGTAAAEGVPALFCRCENCARSRALGGRNIRTRSQAMIDGRLLIDFGPDTFAHTLAYGDSLADLRDVLITHTHEDHFYPLDFGNRARGFCNFVDREVFPLTVWGSSTVTQAVEDFRASTTLDLSGRLETRTLDCFVPVEIAGYTVTPLVGVHNPASGPYIYLIEKDGRALLYAHDTGPLPEENYACLRERGVKLHFVSLDCTEAMLQRGGKSHMQLISNIAVRDRLVAEGLTAPDVRFCCNHFSHNADSVVYDDFVPIAAREGFLVSYDGMVVEV